MRASQERAGGKSEAEAMREFRAAVLWTSARALRTTARCINRAAQWLRFHAAHRLHVRADGLTLRANAMDELRGEDRVAESVQIVTRNLDRTRPKGWTDA